MGRIEVRLTGFGGQGIVLAGIILARAAMYDGKEVAQNQSFGPEARGGACQSEVAMSQEALEKHINSLKKGGKLILDSDMISRIPKKSGIKINKVNATSIAVDKLGKRILANIIMLGALSSLTNIVSKEAVKKAVKESVPEETEEINLEALAEGFSEFQEKMARK